MNSIIVTISIPTLGTTPVDCVEVKGKCNLLTCFENISKHRWVLLSTESLREAPNIKMSSVEIASLYRYFKLAGASFRGFASLAHGN